MRRIIITTILSLFVVSPALANLDMAIESGVSQKSDAEKSLSTKNSRDERDSSGKRKSKTRSTGHDMTWQDAKRAVEQAQQSVSADTTVSLTDILIRRLLLWEQGVEPFKSLQVLSRPKLPADFGLSAESDGRIDSIRKQYLGELAASNGAITSVADERAVREYRDALAYYGSVLAEASLRVDNSIDRLSRRDKSGRIIGIGYDDIAAIAEESLDGVIKTGIATRAIKDLYYAATSNNTPCRFRGTLEAIVCGNTTLTLSSPPQMLLGSTEFFGKSAAGLNKTFRISASYSLSNALETMSSTSRYKKFASDIQDYTDKMESEGRATEAAAVKKNAVDAMKSGKKSLSLQGFLGKLSGK